MMKAKPNTAIPSPFSAELSAQIRAKFHHVDTCPFETQENNARIFFENAGGALTLKSVVETSARLAAIPDNQGRDNPASKEMMRLIAQGKADMLTFLGASQKENDGLVFIGESGTECLFRVIRAALLAAKNQHGGGKVIGSTLEHPATSSAAKQWSARLKMPYTAIAHDPKRGLVTAADYQKHLTQDTRLATIIQTSPVTGIAVDLPAIVSAIRAIAPHCFIIVDGIQHAPHGDIRVAEYNIDAYAISAYKVFSRHNYGFAWVSKRLSEQPHDQLTDTAITQWELGTRDAAEYATFSEVVNYLIWLGAQVAPQATSPRAKLIAAGKAITAHESALTTAMVNGFPEQKGLAAMPRVSIIGGADNPAREGLVSLAVRDLPSAEVVRALNKAGIRTHTRKRDTYSAAILIPLNLQDCVRVSIAHYNTLNEIKTFLHAIEKIAT